MSINWDIQTFDELDSTQKKCFELARESGQEGLVVCAQKQTAGKGRHGREWETGEGNLAFSCVLKPRCDFKDIGQLAIVVGLALANTFKSYTSAPVTLKWPNDVFLAGKKCAGILIESETEMGQIPAFAVVGVGVNIASGPEYANALNNHTETSVDVERFLSQVLASIEAQYRIWHEDGFEKIRSAWNALSLQDIDENGHLIEGDVRHAAGD